jgi:ribonuclease-3
MNIKSKSKSNNINIIKKSDDNSVSSDSSNNEDIKTIEEKRIILPVFNDNNIYITEIFLRKIFEKGNINIEKIDRNTLNAFQKAFIHKSYYVGTYKDDDRKKNEKYFGTIDVNMDDFKNCIELQNTSNEVIEWLGDGIIQSVSAIYLYDRFPKQQEGFLTKIRSKLVKTESLSKLALALNFEKYIMMSKHIEVMANGRKNARILEDSFEAFIGCMMNYFGEKSKKDGFDICYKFIVSVIESNIDFTELIMNNDNFKDQLMQFFQKKYDGKFPIYESKQIIQTLRDNGTINKKFNMCVKDISGKVIGSGIASSKKEAEQLAAKQALMYFGITNS